MGEKNNVQGALAEEISSFFNKRRNRTTRLKFIYLTPELVQRPYIIYIYYNIYIIYIYIIHIIIYI